MADLYAVDSFLKKMAWAEKYGLFENEPYRSFFRVWSLGAADEPIIEMLEEAVLDLKSKEVFGQLVSFREPHLDDGELVLGASNLARQIRVPLKTASSGFLLSMPSGEGKTSFLRFFLPQLAAHDVAVWIFDQAKHESRHLAPFFPPGDRGLVTLRPQDMKYDPLHPGDSDLRRHLTNVSMVLTRGLGLGDRSHTVIYQTCDFLYGKFGNWEGRTDAYPNCFDVYEVVKSTPGINPAVRESILDRMAPMLLEMKPWRLGWNPSDLSKHSVCFEMAGANDSYSHVISDSLIFTVFQAEIEHGAVNAPLKLFVVFDDAQAYVQEDPSGRMTSLELAAGTVRSAGLGVCLCLQTLAGVSRKLVPNLTGLKIMGRPGSNYDAQRFGSDLSLDQGQIKDAKQRLSQGTYIAKTNQWPEPFLLHVPWVPIERHVTDEEVGEGVKALDYLKTAPAEEYADWSPNYLIRVRPTDDENESREQAPSSNGGDARTQLSKEELDYFQSVATSPFLGATQRDGMLGISAYKGNRIRGQLLKKYLVSAVAISPGGRGRRFQLLQLTENGEQLLKSYGIPISNGRGRGGIEHRWWTWRVSKWLKQKGFEAAIEDESLGARVDIVVECEQGMVAVEIETSHGRELSNIQKDLDAGFSTVVSLLKSPNQADKLRAKLVKELPEKIPQVHVGNLTEYAEVLEGLSCFGRS